MKKYVFRIYAGWMAYDPMISESIVYAPNDDVAYDKAMIIADGKAFTINRAWEY